METWKKVFRDGIAPQIPVAGLEALRAALLSDDPRLLQGSTVDPPPIPQCADWPCERAEAVAFALWQAEGLTTVTAIEDRWAQVMAECDRLVNEPDTPAICRWFLNWYDDVPRDEMRRQLLPEVERALAARIAGAA